MAIQVPLINGVVWSFAHVELQIQGLIFTGGFTSIKYKRERKRDQVMSNSPDPVGQTLGENKYSASVTVLLAWWLQLKRTIERQLGAGYGDQAFTMTSSYGHNDALDPFQDVLVGCHFDSTDADQSAGTKALERVIDLQPLKIYFDGDDDLANPLTAA